MSQRISFTQRQRALGTHGLVAGTPHGRHATRTGGPVIDPKSELGETPIRGSGSGPSMLVGGLVSIRDTDESCFVRVGEVGGKNGERGGCEMNGDNGIGVHRKQLHTQNPTSARGG